MWGVNGAYSFAAEDAGASRVVAVDVVPATQEFEDERKRRGSIIEFVHGDVTLPETLAAVGVVDIVFCAGVLHHHPSPYELLLALRELTGRKLIMNTATIPEVPGLPHAAVYYPMMDAKDRTIWDQKERGLRQQIAIQTPYEPEVGYSNWFWGMSASCVRALLETAGFRVERADEHNPFAYTFICSTTTKVVEELQGRLRIPAPESSR